MKKVLTVSAVIAASIWPALITSSASASSPGPCNATQCYISVHTDPNASLSWLSDWENALHSTDGPLINKYSYQGLGYWNGNIYQVQFCTESCNNQEAMHIYIGSESWLSSKDLTIPSDYGYHTAGTAGNTGWNGPYAVIDTTEVNNKCGSTSFGDDYLEEKVISHETDEMMADPYVNTYEDGVLMEVVDPVAGDYFEYTVQQDQTVVDLTDFVLPSYWLKTGSPWDYQDLLSGPYPATYTQPPNCDS